MATFAEMTVYMSKRLIDPDNTAVSADDVKQEINTSIAYWKKRRFWFNEVNDTATLTAQNPDFPYPDDFLVPVIQDAGFVIEYGGIRWPLSKVDMPVYDSLFLTNGYGLPRWYARNGNEEYQCYPIPDQNYTVRRHYLKDYEDLENDGDHNDFTDYADRLIELWGIGNLFYELRQDEESGDKFHAKAMDEYRQLQVMTNKANSSGKLVLTSTLTNTIY